ncbi:hypothetical protein PVAND_000329 [Polypedilum vanderplanki]|uniref:Odorant receptor n=1 Tax=Polypedilum vanderplanki TaxID=319348 RepID=A0A9J6BKL9_POLVA|nr:hypothetical protein PVAND_000329 [Polypedilum vanderplanki]
MDIVIKTLPNLALIPYNTSKAIIFYIQRKKIVKLLEALIENWKLSQVKTNYKSELKKFQFLNKFYIITYVLIMTLPTITSVYEYICKQQRKEMIEVWFPWDSKNNDLGFFIGMAFIYWSGSNVCFIIVSADFYIFSTITVLSILFDALKNDIKAAVNAKNVKKLKIAIERHQKLILISDNLEKIFSFIFIYSFLNAAFALGFSGFELAAAKTLHEYSLCVPFMIGALAQIYFYCYYGEKLLIASVSVANGIFESNWDDLHDSKVRKLLILVIQRSQKAKKLNVLGFSELTLDTFTKISTSAYSYYTLLKDIYYE